MKFQVIMKTPDCLTDVIEQAAREQSLLEPNEKLEKKNITI